MTKNAFGWLLGALMLSTLQIGFGLFEIYVRQIEPVYSVVLSFSPSVLLNIIMFVYLLRKKKDVVACDARDKK
jgi:hypothetical protein